MLLYARLKVGRMTKNLYHLGQYFGGSSWSHLLPYTGNIWQGKIGEFGKS